jgi:hypothetical protein
MRLGILLLVGCFTISAFAATTVETLPQLASDLSYFSAYATATDGVRLNWSLDKQSPTLLKYRIYRGYAEVGDFAVLSEIDAHSASDSVEYSFKDSSARSDVSYFYKLAAVMQNSESVFPVVITATRPEVGENGQRELPPAVILKGDVLTLYVRTPGHVKLSADATKEKALIDDSLNPGIYEITTPLVGKTHTLHLEHGLGYQTDVNWPLK